MVNPKKALIIRLSSIGDILLTTPLIRIYKERFPSCRIDYVIKKDFQELIACHPNLSKIYVFDKHAGTTALKKLKQEIKTEQYDIIIDLHKNLRSVYLRKGIHADKIFKFKKYIIYRWLLVNLKLNLYKRIVPVYQRYIDSLKDFQLEYDGAGLDLFIPSKTAQNIKQRWNGILNSRYNLIVGLAPGASFFTKRWPVEGYIEVTKYLIQKFNSTIFLFGNEQDRQISSEICLNLEDNLYDVTGTLSLLETAALMNYCHLVITNDTGLMHIASALKKKVVAIFGSTTEELGFFPYTTNSIVVQNTNLDCRPCSHIGRHHCPKKHFKCMIDIKSSQIIEAINTLI